MRRRLAISAALFGLVGSVAAPAAAQSPMPYVVAMAQHFVHNRLMKASATEHYYIQFDQSFVYSQPRKTLWVVVGGYVSAQNNFNSFTAAVLLDCPEFQKIKCWSLEKLSINGQIVLDKKRI